MPEFILRLSAEELREVQSALHGVDDEYVLTVGRTSDTTDGYSNPMTSPEEYVRSRDAGEALLAKVDALALEARITDA